MLFDRDKFRPSHAHWLCYHHLLFQNFKNLFIVSVLMSGFCLTYVCQSVSSERMRDANMKLFSLLICSGPPHTIPNHVLNPCLKTSSWSGEQSEARGKGFR